MAHSKETTAAVTANEPPNGTVLAVRYSGDCWKVVVRDDKSAADEWDAHPEDRWFDANNSTDDPMSLHEHIKYADAVYALGAPLAEFP